MEADKELKQPNTEPVYLAVLDDDDSVCEDVGSSEAPTSEPVIAHLTETAPPVTKRPAEALPPVTPRPAETPPPVTPRPPETLPPVTPRPTDTPPPVTARPGSSKVESSEGPARNYEEISIDGSDYEEIPLEHTEYDEIPYDGRDLVEIKVDEPPIRRDMPLPNIPTQTLPVTATLSSEKTHGYIDVSADCLCHGCGQRYRCHGNLFEG